MNQEIRTCQNCKTQFIIEPEDFQFYEKIKVPPPTFCPECRQRRRYAWRNERVLYRRTCDLCGKSTVTVYSPSKPFKVYCPPCWWSDKWDSFDYGREYDFSKPFFKQYRELLERVPLIALSVTNMVNCSYCNVAEGDKDCYLAISSERNERVRYANRVVFSKDSQDIYIGDHHELCYEMTNSVHCYHDMFCFKCRDCVDSTFLFDCTNCNNCFGCTNLKNKSYCIFNGQYTKEEYKKKLAEFDLGSYAVVEKLRTRFEEMRRNALHRYAYNYRCQNVTGDNIVQGKNLYYCFDIVGPAEDAKYMVWGGVNAKDVHDGDPGVGISAENVYEAFDSGIKSSKLYFTGVVYGSTEVYYSINCHGSKDLFGCYGVRSGEYCILNKKYAREEYEELIPKIIEHMNTMPYVDATGRTYRYGEFFPIEISPFSYNETIAQDYHPITKDRAVADKYPWKEPEGRNYQITKTPDQLPDHIKDIPDSITQEVIECANSPDAQRGRGSDPQASGCATAFRIIPDELEFYRRMNIPLPRLCFGCRHTQRLKLRNPLKLWHRRCACLSADSASVATSAKGAALAKADAYQNTVSHFHGENPCPNEFETSYAPDRPEIVYCEQCYQAEVV